MSSVDLVVRGGAVIDGTGADKFSADVAIDGGVIVDVGNVSTTGKREINAEGALVTPGFVDIHTHYDGLATWANRMNPSSHHGVTSVVMGNCGVGFAPVRSADHNMLVELMEGVEDIPGTALHEGLPWAWESFPDYLDYLATREFDMDIGTQLPHAALRVYVMGERGANREEATADDIAEMKRLTEEAIRAGALGFSSSRTLNHRSINGDPTPSLTAAQAELIGIGEGLRAAGGGVLEMISDFKGLDLEFEILMSMVDSSGVPMSISLAQGANNPDGWRKILGKIAEANKQGRRVKAQVAPRAIGILFGLTASNTPFSGCDTYRAISRLPLPEKVARLQNPETRAALLNEASEKVRVDYRKLWVIDDNWDYEPDPSASVAALASAAGKTPEEYALDSMLNNGGKQLLYSPFANYANDNLDCCREMILDEHTIMGLGDGGAHVGVICDASFITYLVSHWGRDRKRGELIDLPILIKAQTADTAAAVGLSDRGLIQPGLRADLNVIDFDRLRLQQPEMVNDLPSGAARLEQRAEGYLATVVAGEITYQGGESTGALPGRLIRR